MQRFMGWLVVGLIALWSPVALALTPLGHACFRLDPFADVVDFLVAQDELTGTVYTYAVTWRGDISYLLEGGGTATGKNILDLVFTADHQTAFFGGNPVCHVQAVLDLSSRTGPWRFVCDQGPEPFANAGTLVSLASCPTGEALTALQQGLHAQGARLAGEPYAGTLVSLTPYPQPRR